ncbi:GNAT family N-acetyltransferase [Microbacterium sp. BK668]|uniref:GNAT family N-acetyltransferase n=1 Tax=Microbacterium sp. BK668 TaxID=2512118 RepID=UPI00105B5454|nr:GNAT family N-acetyltransferase [Microbacterium sp. BK668]
MRIRDLTPEDWPAVEEIYRHGIEDGDATFESQTPTWETFDAGRIGSPRLVAERDGSIVGWAAASPISPRPVYRGVIEHSVYIRRDARGSGVGRALLDAFVQAADEAGFWMIQASVFPENSASLRLHESAGFRVVGRRERIARSRVGPHAGEWRDTILIERRSTRNGLD